MSSARLHVSTPVRRTALAVVASALSVGLVGLAMPAHAATASDYQSSAESLAANTVAPTQVAVDAFGRQVNGGWGSATTGGAWATTGGSASDYTVADGVASMTIQKAGWKLGSSLPTVKSTDTDLRAVISLDKAPVGGHVDAEVSGRDVSTTASYRLRAKVLADGNVRVSLISVDGSTVTTLASQTLIGLGTTGKQLNVHLVVTGTAPTTLNAKVWSTTATEPADWQLTATDSTPALQAPGGIAFSGYTGSSVTNAPITLRVSDVRATSTGTVTPPPVVPGPVGSYVPDATTTGVPNGTKLTVHQGDLTITTPNAVIDGLDVRGFVKVAAPNVTIKNSIVRGAPTSKQTALITSASSTASVTVIDSELYNSAPGPWVDGVRGYNFTLQRVNLHDVIDMAHVYGDNVTIEASYLHDNLHYEVDPAQNNTPSHDDSIQIQKGNNMRIVGNNISGAFNTGIQFTQDQG
ncbi:hypothetical protein HGA02_08545, partial [Cellulomonas septica]|nr:hypothetical protein [Cellulomonas septica]